MAGPASLKRRLAAHLIDRSFVVLVGMFPALYVEALASLSDRIVVNPYFPPFLVPWFLSVYAFYVLLVEGLCGGQTLGKRLLGLRVVDGEGKPIGIRASLVRNLLRAVDSFPLFLYGVGVVLARREGGRLGDRLARTRVVRDPSPVPVRRGPPALAFLLVVVAPNLLFPVALRATDAPVPVADGPFLKGVVVTNWSNDSAVRGRALDLMAEAGFNAVRFHDFKHLPPPEVIRDMAQRNLTVILGTGETWTVRRGPEDARRMVAVYGNLSAVAFWAIGNEDYNPDLTVPKAHLRSVHDAFRAADRRPTLMANHMVLNAPDLVPFGFLGYGPVEFTDAYGFNAYPTLQAASWVNLIQMWHNDTRRTVDPATGAFLDLVLGAYYGFEKVFIEPVKKSTFGYPYWLHSYIAFGKLRNRTVMVTEYGGEPPEVDVARGHWRAMEKFPELRGSFYYHWDYIDRGNDGTVDDEGLFRFFREEAR